MNAKLLKSTNWTNICAAKEAGIFAINFINFINMNKDMKNIIINNIFSYFTCKGVNNDTVYLS
ncbi:hypothetical protein [[Mycoplasma] anseris]|uniref:Uncharacterized protein n=1 Tax=[Mycoplasma] anseris TaxID=92400 RepID=A0A2Z4ND74_9BACT|nr:hypothetical protein [[Mycoplasma] anseris]AWX69446.1 hypothetical protein DP065_01600 [[Mycoplasma] anseris]